ncbi:E3 ubiquitin-protein ligase XB3 [Hordeum vulgare]|uniref:RING-type E3 ubiquitin transferase n=1 Tax=Hordeum vulgare subsp. vulgare TaxID=112509 RepID=A0A8I6XKQ8_HORVV|nr:E3 ubiquitin-protein ligase XB3-like [Hordeum vulgare subsp. vulgare]KAE8774670.1 E3 ubiquitin-protein ligase XB3 [Hordeum vulgare]
MGHGLSCSRDGDEHDFFRAAQAGDLDALDGLLAADPALARRATLYDRLTALHVAAANGCLPAVDMLLARGVRPDVVDRRKRTPLMLAATHGHIDCALALLRAGANILMFDSVNARTCLHHAAYYGHADCLRAILAAARTTPVADSWGFVRFVNVRDEHGATPLHVAARQGRPECVHLLLESGAIVSAPTGSYGFPGSTALHLAARGGSLECVRELLAWGADRVHRDSAGRIAYSVATKRGHGACAALLNPSAAEPMVWPSPLKFIGELGADARALLEAALAEANREREKKILKGTNYTDASPALSDAGGDDDADDVDDQEDEEVCSICFEQACSIEVEDCGHRMCAACTLALCCHSKPNPATLTLQPPACPFCRSCISRLVVADSKAKAVAVVCAGDEAEEKQPASPRLSRRRSRRSREGSSSFKGLSSAMGSLSSKIGRGSGRLAGDSDGVLLDKLEHHLP